MLEKIKNFIAKHDMLKKEDCVIVGVSGGADSVCLLFVLMELQKSMGFRLVVVHVNHGLRGESAARDELFVKQICEKYDLSFVSYFDKVELLAKKWKQSTEEAGRNFRRECFEKTMKEMGGTKIALAHHKNDNVETMFMNLARGTGLKGLGGIVPVQGYFIRPLLCVERKEIEEYLHKNKIAYCVDETNTSDDYTRNKIRHNILSYAQAEINHGAIAHTARAAGELRELSAYLAKEAEALCAQAEKTERGLRLPVVLLEQVPTPVREMAVHSLLTEVSGCSRDMTKEHVTAVSGLCRQQSGKQVALPYGMTAKREFDFLVIEQERQPETGLWVPAACKVEVPGEYRISPKGDTLTFRCFSYEKNGEIPKNKYTKWFDYDKIKGALYLRLRKDGDRMGMVQGSKSVKQLYMEHKIEKEERGRSLLLAAEAQVPWIPGVRACDNYRIDDKTKTILEVRLSGGNKGEG